MGREGESPSCSELPVGKPSPPEVSRAVRHGVICVLFKQRGQHWEGKEETEELSNKPKRAFLVLANSDTWGLSCQGLYITVVWLLKTPSNQATGNTSREEITLQSFDGVFPKYYSPVLKGPQDHPISTPQYHTSENVQSRICRQWGHKPLQMPLLTALVKCFQ